MNGHRHFALAAAAAVLTTAETHEVGVDAKTGKVLENSIEGAGSD